MVGGGASLVPSVLTGPAAIPGTARWPGALDPWPLLAYGRPWDKVWKVRLCQRRCSWFLGCAGIDRRLDPEVKGTGEGPPLWLQGDPAPESGRESSRTGRDRDGKGNRREALLLQGSRSDSHARLVC